VVSGMEPPSSVRGSSKYSWEGGTVYLVILEFPVESENDENLTWLQTCRTEVEEFCDEYCLKLGALYVLSKPYFPIAESFLRRVSLEYRNRGYSPTFKFLQVSLQGRDYVDLQRLIIDRVQSRLEICLSGLEGEELNDSLASEALKEVTKANELMLIFQLSKVFPSEATRVHDLISILNEKTSEFKLHKSKEVVVTEL